jgi:putative DNA primase/helicase
MADDTPEDRYAPLFELASARGEERLRLLGHEMVRLAMRLKVKDGERFAKLINRLSAWPHVGMFKTSINRAMADAKRKKAEEDEAEAAMERLASAAKEGFPRIPEGKPVDIAGEFIAQVMPDLIHLSGEWLNYSGNHYETIEKEGVRSVIQAWMAKAVNDQTGAPVLVNKKALDEVVDALKSRTFKPFATTKPPIWLEPADGDPDPKMALACGNGLLDVMSGDLIANTPRFFTRNGLSYDYEDPYFTDAPHTWLEFLEQVWPDAEGGRPNKESLQEWFGHLLTGDFKYQKILLLLGESRGGKGVIVRVLNALIGTENIAETNLDALTGNFGLRQLLGKSVMVVPDMRIGKDTSRALEVILNISGGDRVYIDRKFLDGLNERLNTRIVLVSNLEMTMPDQAGALANRLMPLVFTKSFKGREDVTLADRIIATELPGILHWALEGLRRLEARRDEHGRQIGFVQTPMGAKRIEALQFATSPIRAFVTGCCDLEAGASVPKTVLFDAFEGFCREHDIQSRYIPETFARDLMRSGSGYRVESLRVADETGKRVPCYMGIRLKPEFEGYDWLSVDDGEY